MIVVSGVQDTNCRDRTKIWSDLDILDCGVSATVSLEVSFPSLDFCAEGNDVHDSRG